MDGKPHDGNFCAYNLIMTNALTKFGNPDLLNDSVLNAVSERNDSIDDNLLIPEKKEEKSK